MFITLSPSVVATTNPYRPFWDDDYELIFFLGGDWQTPPPTGAVYLPENFRADSAVALLWSLSEQGLSVCVCCPTEGLLLGFAEKYLGKD